MHSIQKLTGGKIYLPLLFLGFTFSMCAQVRNDAYYTMLQGLLERNVPEITVKDAAALGSNCLLLDAREPKEYAVSHLAGAVSVGYDHFSLNNLPAGLAKDRRIVVYCSVGYRSEKVTQQLLKAGYTHVANMYGGIFEWVNQGYPIVNAGGPTADVHAFDRNWGVWLQKGRKVY